MNLMKRVLKTIIFVCAVSLSVLLVPGECEATEVGTRKTFGVGAILGEPTGGTLKLWFNDSLALQSHQAVTWWYIHRLAVFVDVVWHPHTITRNEYFTLKWYVGVGGGMGIRAPWHYHPHGYDPDGAIWVRAPFGFPFLFEKFPLEAFVEFGPMVRVVPPAAFSPFVAVGARYYF